MSSVFSDGALEVTAAKVRGLPPCCAPAVALFFFAFFLWQTLSRQDVDYFRGLMSEVERVELVTDELYSLDVQFISDDDKYFPFEVLSETDVVEH